MLLLQDQVPGSLCLIDGNFTSTYSPTLYSYDRSKEYLSDFYIYDKEHHGIVKFLGAYSANGVMATAGLSD